MKRITLICVSLLIFAGCNVPAKILLGNANKNKAVKASTDIKTFSTALNMYHLDNNMYPTTEQGLKALIEQPASVPAPANWQPGGYIALRAIPNDPWGSPYIYRSPGDNGEDFLIISYGADKKEGGEGYDADIRSSDLR